MSNPFGPEDAKVYVVDLETGQISDYMTSADKADCDKENVNYFFSFKDAHDKGMEIIVASGGGLLDMTNYQEEEAMMDSMVDSDRCIYVGESTDYDDLPVWVNGPVMRNKLRLSVAKEIIAYFKANGNLTKILQHVEVPEKNDEKASVEAFIEWINDYAFQGCLTSQKELCRYYKDVFIPEVNNK